MFKSPKGFIWKFSDFCGKEQKATSHTGTTYTWSCLSQNQEEVFRGHSGTSLHLPPSPDLLCSCWQCQVLAKQTAPRSEWTRSCSQSMLQAQNSRRVIQGVNQTCSQPLSTKLTFEPQPLIEHWLISLGVCSTVPGSQGSAFTEVG